MASVKGRYRVERVNWTQSDGSDKAKAAPLTTKFENDIDEQAHVIVGFHVLGPCPSCGHDTSDVCPTSNAIAVDRAGTKLFVNFVAAVLQYAQLTSIVGYAFVRGLEFFLERTTVCVITCRCSEDHTVDLPVRADNPSAWEKFIGSFSRDDEKPATAAPAVPTGPGCGSRWLVEATYRLSTKTVSSIRPVEKDAYKYWSGADALAADTTASLTNVQATAGKWQQTVTAILGLLAIASLVGGRDSIQKLSSHSQIGLGATAGTALLSSAFAFAMFARASSGIPRLRLTAGPRALKDADLKPLRQARKAALYFRLTIALAFVSLGCAIAAIFIVWFTKPAEASKNVEVTVVEGTTKSTLCGALAINPNDGTITIKPGIGGTDSTTFSRSQVVAIGASC